MLSPANHGLWMGARAIAGQPRHAVAPLAPLSRCPAPLRSDVSIRSGSGPYPGRSTRAHSERGGRLTPGPLRCCRRIRRSVRRGTQRPRGLGMPPGGEHPRECPEQRTGLGMPGYGTGVLVVARRVRGGLGDRLGQQRGEALQQLSDMAVARPIRRAVSISQGHVRRRSTSAKADTPSRGSDGGTSSAATPPLPVRREDTACTRSDRASPG